MRGFTLVELIIYIAILVVILVLAVSFLWMIVSGNIKEGFFQEVQQNGRFALTKITQEIKKATGIISPSLAGSANFLSLRMADPNLNPTIFDVDNGKLRIIQGSNPSYYLTTDQVIVSNLQFTNLSYENTPGAIQIDITIDHLNPGGRMEYQASVNLKSTVSLVPGGAALTFERLKPTAHTDILGRTTNPGLAYDEPNGTTWATTVYRDTGDSITFHTWQMPTKSYTNLVLKYRYHADSATDDKYGVAYSTTGCSGAFTYLISPTSIGAPDTTVSAGLSPSQDLSQLCLKINSEQIRAPDSKNLYTRDIWTEGTY
jgi:type II secretory pathway pseudopilin PulG